MTDSTVVPYPGKIAPQKAASSDPLLAAGPDTNCVSPVAADAFRIIRIREVSELTGLGRGTIYQRIKSDPTFPRPVPLSDSTARGAPVGFVLSEVQAWVLSRMAKRDVAA